MRSKSSHRTNLSAVAFLAAAGFLLGLAIANQAQSGRPTPTPPDRTGSIDDGDTIKVRTDEVMIPVTVRNSEGKRVEGLTPADFMIFDNGKRQEIAGFNRERTPVQVILLLDASGSVFEHMEFIRESAIKFVAALRPEDSVSVMQFADDVQLLQDWTSAGNSSVISKALNKRYRPGLSTSFYDGVYLAAKEQMAKVSGRKIIILLTDGIDMPKVKHANRVDAVKALRYSEAALYVISLTGILRNNYQNATGNTKTKQVMRGYDPRQVKQDQQTINDAEDSLSEMATISGGYMFLPLLEEDLKESLQAISEELRSQYIITYRPTSAPRSGEWRDIKVLVGSGGLEVQARDGYRGRAD
ncbi:MAG: VWA domain-containing protein [Pyrinomonadaceae bacterium]